MEPRVLFDQEFIAIPVAFSHAFRAVYSLGYRMELKRIRSFCQSWASTSRTFRCWFFWFQPVSAACSFASACSAVSFCLSPAFRCHPIQNPPLRALELAFHVLFVFFSWLILGFSFRQRDSPSLATIISLFYLFSSAKLFSLSFLKWYQLAKWWMEGSPKPARSSTVGRHPWDRTAELVVSYPFTRNALDAIWRWQPGSVLLLSPYTCAPFQGSLLRPSSLCWPTQLPAASLLCHTTARY